MTMVLKNEVYAAAIPQENAKSFRGVHSFVGILYDCAGRWTHFSSFWGELQLWPFEFLQSLSQMDAQSFNPLSPTASSAKIYPRPKIKKTPPTKLRPFFNTYV